MAANTKTEAIPDLEVVHRHFREGGAEAFAGRMALNVCQNGEDRIKLMAEREESLKRVDAWLDYYNEHFLGLTYGTTT